MRTAVLVFVAIPYLTSLLVAHIRVDRDAGGGMVNNMLLEFGLISSPLPLIYNRLAVYVGMVHIMLQVMILPLVSVMLGIDKALMSAARSMGARPLAAFWRVFFPLGLPGVRSGSLLVFVLCLGCYITLAALGGLRDTMLSTFIASQVETSFNVASIAASAVILLAVAAAVLAIFELDLSGTQGRPARPARAYWWNRLLSLSTLARYLNELATPYRAKRWTLPD
nr:ABC transporter permease subunit [Bradyrhizobium sp. sGM-13]